MLMTPNEKKILTQHEAARELQEVGLSAQADITCTYCEEGIEGKRVHTLGGEAFCAMCAIDEVFRLRSAATWAGLEPKLRLEVWEVLGAAANELESQLRAELRTGKVA